MNKNIQNIEEISEELSEKIKDISKLSISEATNLKINELNSKIQLLSKDMKKLLNFVKKLKK